ncbi:uncharacterized protein LOC125314298 [Rhodamnia argentea]|uniref:Uncharacterized protein LOC125314298 n=1 Tax=Rhodamnia argentea TaxID=178133 RepID=A0ABM3H6K0_9MYRT|nr:uncharacterized protein LOC125314298 [Rhodamnia argentea]
MEEFLRLCQNQLTVDEYEAKFAEMSKYAPRMIEDPVDRAKRFRDGLKLEIKSVLVPLNLKDYNELYERAQMVEHCLLKGPPASGSRCTPSNQFDRRQGKRSMPSGKHYIPPNRRRAINKPIHNSINECRFCKQRHGTTPCPFGMGACFGCGQRGHQVKDCPQKQQYRSRWDLDDVGFIIGSDTFVEKWVSRIPGDGSGNIIETCKEENGSQRALSVDLNGECA